MTQASRELSSTKKDDVIRRLHLYVTVAGSPTAPSSNNLTYVSTCVVSTTCRKFRNEGTTESNKADKVKRRPRHTSKAIQQNVGAVPIDQHSTMRDISFVTGIPLGTLSRHLNKGAFRRRSTRIKPLLSDATKLERVRPLG
ncbi:hypothetical protein B5M09_013442 [Aphanomyces astaci]|uniref:Uncharacterized protein n=1 Tax=Aphanomyces astaci TaxID=112090 RepID=A0A425DJM2_APHAT|nr:hypothetical protein B5M09_013442 [Aphanomyces astaci]